jgi:hypothetical protein
MAVPRPRGTKKASAAAGALSSPGAVVNLRRARPQQRGSLHCRTERGVHDGWTDRIRRGVRTQARAARRRRAESSTSATGSWQRPFGYSGHGLRLSGAARAPRAGRRHRRATRRERHATCPMTGDQRCLQRVGSARSLSPRRLRRDDLLQNSEHTGTETSWSAMQPCMTTGAAQPTIAVYSVFAPRLASPTPRRKHESSVAQPRSATIQPRVQPRSSQRCH